MEVREFHDFYPVGWITAGNIFPYLAEFFSPSRQNINYIKAFFLITEIRSEKNSGSL
jgi:hypothetical protein